MQKQNTKEFKKQAKLVYAEENKIIASLAVWDAGNFYNLICVGSVSGIHQDMHLTFVYFIVYRLVLNKTNF